MYGYLCETSRVPFEIPHKISYSYIERYAFYSTLKFYDLLDLRAHMHFWNASPKLYILVWQMIASAHAMYHRWRPLDVGNPIVVMDYADPSMKC